MTQGKNGDGIALDDVMLAMDVADTLRHHQELVQRELDADARDRALREKVKRIYAAQGIEVSDEVIAEAVKSLRDERFTYTPPPAGLRTRLWRLYVRRGKWGRRIGAAVAALLAAWGIHYGVVEIPKQRQLARETRALEAGLATAREQIRLLRERAGRLRKRLEAAPPAPAGLTETAASLRREAETTLGEADRLLASAEKLAPKERLSPEALASGKEAVEKRMAGQKSLLGQADDTLDRARDAVGLLERLPELPATLDRLRHEATGIAKVEEARNLAEQLYRDGIAALRNREAEKAREAIGSLRKLIGTLRQTYTLQVVSRPGEKSGVWRYPDVNPGARNYYLIVEAIGPDGKVLEMPVRSEEDGSLKRVKKWGLRVDRRDYEQIARDKQDDGIIQHREVGAKKRGYLKPEYRVATSGATITEW